MVLVDGLPLVGRNGTVLHVGYRQGLDCVMVLVDSLPLVGRNGTVLHVGYQQGLDVLWFLLIKGRYLFLLIVCHKWGETALYCTLAIDYVWMNL